MTRNEIVKMLMAEGHSAIRAFEIAIDYERGDKWARTWVDYIASTR